MHGLLKETINEKMLQTTTRPSLTLTVKPRVGSRPKFNKYIFIGKCFCLLLSLRKTPPLYENALLRKVSRFVLPASNAARAEVDAMRSKKLSYHV